MAKKPSKKKLKEALEVVQSLTRKQIRYSMFRYQTFLSEGVELPDYDYLDSVLTHYENAEGFISWETFAHEWDIGIDDLPTMISRPNKFWCFGYPKETIIIKTDFEYDENNPNDSLKFAARYFRRKGFDIEEDINSKNFNTSLIKAYNQMLEEI